MQADGETQLLAKETVVAADYFLKLDPKVEGESADSKHKGEIELESWSFGVSNASSALQGGGAGSGKSVPLDFNATKKTDKSTPRLAQAVATGDHFKSAIITVRKAGGTQQEYLTITLSDVFISSYQAGGSGGGSPANGVDFLELLQDGPGVQGTEGRRLARRIDQAGVRLAANKSRSDDRWNIVDAPIVVEDRFRLTPFDGQGHCIGRLPHPGSRR